MKLSIIIPTLGRETLAEVLQGIRDCEGFQEIRPEIIVVFDGVAATAPSRLPDVKFLETAQHFGVSAARNVGIENATGDVLVFLGDDTIPTKNWLRKVHTFHLENPAPTKGLLGMVSWTPELMRDPFHRWLLDHAQFAFSSIRRHGTTWRHFYTSNVSVKKSLVGDTRFPQNFQGWGFEDILFGFELSEKGLVLHFDGSCEVLHDHAQTLSQVLANTRNARKNAETLERRTGMRIRPQGLLRLALQLALVFSAILAPFSRKISWWREWKKTWIDKI